MSINNGNRIPFCLPSVASGQNTSLPLQGEEKTGGKLKVMHEEVNCQFLVTAIFPGQYQSISIKSFAASAKFLVV